MENVLENLLLADSEVRIVIVGMGADVDDAVHVQVQVVKLRNLVFLHNFTETGIPLTEPSVELGDTHLVLIMLHYFSHHKSHNNLQRYFVCYLQLQLSI